MKTACMQNIPAMWWLRTAHLYQQCEYLVELTDNRMDRRAFPSFPRLTEAAEAVSLPLPGFPVQYADWLCIMSEQLSRTQTKKFVQQPVPIPHGHVNFNWPHLQDFTEVLQFWRKSLISCSPFKERQACARRVNTMQRCTTDRCLVTSND